MEEPGFKVYLKLSTIIIPFLILFASGLVFALLQSFGYLNPVPVQERFIKCYQSLLSDPWFYRSFGFSVYVAFSSALLAVAIGTGLAYLIWRLPLALQKYAIVYKLPLILPHIAVAFIILVLFSRSGIIASLAYQLGLIEEQEQFPALLFAGNGLGIILAYVAKEVPFVMLMVSAIFKKLDLKLIQTAIMLGASRTRVFFKVILPFLSPVLNTTFIILFLYSFGAFDIPYLLGESSPGMLSIQVYNLYFKRDLVNRPYAMGILVMMFCFSAAFIYLYSRIAAKLDIRARKL